MTYTKILWGLLGILFFVEVLWLNFGSLTLYYNWKDLFYQFLFLLSFLLLFVFYKKFRPDSRIELLLESILFLFSYTTVMLILSYLVVTLRFPLVNAQLAAIDEAFGIYMPTLVFWFRNHVMWHNLFVYIYNSFIIQFPLIVLYFSFYNKTIILQRFLMQALIIGLLTSLISCILASAGPYSWYGYTPGSVNASTEVQFFDLRQGIVDLRETNGVVTLPSFHAAMALLYTYTFRNEKNYIFIPILILNILLIFSCIPIGEHYFADILAGILVFLLAVWGERLLYYIINRK